MRRVCAWVAVAVVAALAAAAAGQLVPNTGVVHDFHFVVDEAVGSPDGFQRPMLMVNGQYPGPEIRVNRGDWVRVNVTNRLETQSTVMHWHGIVQGGSSHMDGVPYITQCPIAPGQSFMYEWDTKFQTQGTHWYHSHLGTQRGDGLIGPLIIEDPTEKPDIEYDSDYVFMINDWSHTSAESLYAISEYPPYKLFLPTEILVNGKGRADCEKEQSLPGLNCTAGHAYDRMTMRHGHTYRLRIINAASHTDEFVVSIDRHQMAVVEIDGIKVKPMPNVTELAVATGQRYSVIVTANRGVQNYWLRVRDRDGVEGRAVIHYDGAPDADPQSEAAGPGDGVRTDWLTRYEATFGGERNLWIPPRPVTMPLTFNVTLERGAAANGAPRWAFNNTVFELPPRPVLQSFEEGRPMANNVIRVGMFENVYLVVNNLEPLPHPFHIHGHLFFELGGGPGVYDPRTSKLWDYEDHPVPLRDTFHVHGNSWKMISFTTNNPGAWLFHCHVETHFLRGLAMVFMEGDIGGRPVGMPPLPKDFPRCDNFLHSTSPIPRDIE